MQYSSFILAIVSLVFYVVVAAPLVVVAYSHGRGGIVGWGYLLLYTGLQVVGNGMIAGVGRHGQPSTTAIILTGVGLSPLLAASAGILREWTSTTSLARDPTYQRRASVAAKLFHVATAASIGLLATGGQMEAKPSGDHKLGKTRDLMFTNTANLCAQA
jgi:hypothetical protein